jgi:hypothetical protein
VTRLGSSSVIMVTGVLPESRIDGEEQAGLPAR